jgi:hypothetical protein
VAPAGDDANPGTSPDAPLATVQKCADKVMPGGTCYLRAGVYREGPVVPAHSGTAAAPITFTSYPCEHAVVSGADVVTGWSVHQGKIYEAALATALHEDGYSSMPRTQLFVDGTAVTYARWPNTSGPALLQPDADATAGAGTGSTDIYDAALQGFPDGTWNGAVIHLRGGLAWTSETGTVKTHTGNHLVLSLTPDPNTPINAVKGSRYYLTGTLAALDTAGEWYADGTHVYLWAPAGDDPSGHLVEAKQRDYAFDLSGLSYVTLQGLEIFAASVRTSMSSSHVTLDGLLVKYASHFVMIGPAGGYAAHTFQESEQNDSGVLVHGQGNTLQNSEIAGSAGNGISVEGDGHTITNDLVHDTDYAGIYTALIFVGGSHLTITHNTLYQTGRDAIHVAPISGNAFPSNEIAYNDVHDWGVLNQDEGGVYGCCLVDWTGSSIHHNWFHDLVPTDGRGFHVGYDSHPGAGIYFDNGSGNGLVHHNVTWKTYDGIQVNGLNPTTGKAGPSPGMVVYNNTIGPNAGNGMGSLETLATSTAAGSKFINDIFAGGPLFPQGGPYPNATFANNVSPGTDPKFVNAAAFDFQLAPGSPAIGAGQSIPGITTTTPPDIGAYEGGAWKPGCSIPGCQ